MDGLEIDRFRYALDQAALDVLPDCGVVMEPPQEMIASCVCMCMTFLVVRYRSMDEISGSTRQGPYCSCNKESAKSQSWE